VEEFVCGRCQGAIIRAALGKNAGFNDLRGREVFHAIAGPVVGREVIDERIVVELGCSPHRDLGSNDLLDVAHEGGPSAALVSARRIMTR